MKVTVTKEALLKALIKHKYFGYVLPEGIEIELEGTPIEEKDEVEVKVKTFLRPFIIDILLAQKSIDDLTSGKLGQQPIYEEIKLAQRKVEASIDSLAKALLERGFKLNEK